MEPFKRPPLQGYFAALDGLRGLSILLVMLNHFVIPLPHFLEFFRARGHLGVEVFFAVSGFLVTRSLHVCFHKADFNLKKTLKEFYVRRFARILIPYITVLIAIIALSFVVKSLNTKLNSISDISFSFLTYTYNYAKFFTEGTVPGSLNIMWSLSFEEQFYLFIGLIFIIGFRFFNSILLSFAIISIVWRFLYTFSDAAVDFNKLQFMTHLRLDAILWGCLLYMYWNPLLTWVQKNKWVLNVFIFGAIIAFYSGSSAFSFPIVALSFSLTAVFFTSLILVVQANPGHILTKIFQWSGIVFIGKISYELYLTHQLINALIIKVGFANNPWIYLFTFIPLSLILSWLFFRFVSQPSMKWVRMTFAP